MIKANQDIRGMLAGARIAYWQVAEALGVHENTVIRRMRKELPDRDKKKIFQIIERIKVEATREDLKIG